MEKNKYILKYSNGWTKIWIEKEKERDYNQALKSNLIFHTSLSSKNDMDLESMTLDYSTKDLKKTEQIGLVFIRPTSYL